MSACHLSQSRSRSAASLLAAAALLALAGASAARAQTAPASGGVAPKAGTSTIIARPSAATQAILTAAQAQVKADKFADAVAALTAAETPGIGAIDKQALDFALADAQQAWGTVLIQTSYFADALDHLNSALALDQQYPQRLALTGTDLRRIGIAWVNQGQNEKSINYFEQALAIYRQARDRDNEAEALNNLGIVYNGLSLYEKAIGYFRQALPIYQQVNDQAGEAGTLVNLGSVYDNLRQYEKAIGFYEHALPILRLVKRRDFEANALNNLGNAHRGLSHYERAISYFEQALPIYRQSKDRAAEAGTLVNLGSAYEGLNQHGNAISYFEQALPILRLVKRRDYEANALNNLGVAWESLSQHEKSIGYFEQSLPIFQQVGNRDGEAGALDHLGNGYRELSQYEMAISYLEQALPIYRQVGNRDGEAQTLNDIGSVYSNLSQHEKAISYHEQALAMYRRVDDRDGEASSLCNLGIGYYYLRQYEKAIDYFEQALPIFQQIRNRAFEGHVLGNLGNAYRDMREYPKAIDFLEQALPIYRQARDRDGEAITLVNLGDAYDRLTRYARALDLYERSLLIFRQVKDRANEAYALSRLASAWSAPHNTGRNPRLSILFGKQAVNVLQTIRADIHGLDKQTQEGFAKSKESTYRDLADLLISQGRLPEAQQVLDLLKEQEFFDFVRRDATEAPGLGKAELTTLEARADASIRAEGDKVTEAGARYTTLLEAQKHETDPAKRKALDKQLDAADKARASASVAFEHVLDSLGALFSSSTTSVAQKPLDVRDTEALTSALGTLDEQTHRKTVAIYTLVGDKTLRFLVYTGSATPVAREYPIGAEALNKKVASFRVALQDPYSDPRPLAKQLYDILIGPVKDDIAGAEAGEVMWSLDGTLRYLPIAALSPDGVHYLAEQKIGQSIFTPATLNAGHLTDATQPAWSVLALGVTGARTVDGGDTFPALPGVAGEIGGIVQGSNSSGIFPGTPLLDGDFTQDALIHALRPRQFPLVHIASHFRFRPGDEGASYLLLGVGKLTLTDVKDMPADLFRGVDLLTLSACDTAVGGGNVGSKAGDGSEVESFGVLVQKKGAEAVLATLWPVADVSTPALMQAFYRLRQAHPEFAKAEVLRQAQVALLTGVVKPGADTTASPRRSEVLAVPPKSSSKAGNADAPAFVVDPKRPWSHPYYWAPFILIGNWK